MKIPAISHSVLLFLPLLLMGVVTSCEGQATSDWPFGTPKPATGATATSVSQPAAVTSSKPFVHPGIYYNAQDLAFMRQKLAAQAEPWFSAWQQYKPKAREDSWVPHASAAWDATKDFYMSGDSLVAHKEALQWAMTGNKANAAKAIEIMNAWSSTMQSIIPHQMPQEKLASGINGNQWANAAELLVYGGPNGASSGWAQADIDRFKKMLGMIYDVTKDFQPGYNGNWDAIMMDSMISMSVFLDDHAMFDRAVTHYLQGVKPNGGLTNYVYPSGQCQEDYRDQGHVQWGLGGLIGVCQVAWKQGVDLWSADDNRLMKGLEYTAKFNLGQDVPYVGNGAISQKGRGQFAPIWEAPYQHYVYEEGLDMPFVKQVIYDSQVPVGGRPLGKAPMKPYRPEGDYSAGISWGTFTMYKGPEDPQAVKKQ